MSAKSWSPALSRAPRSTAAASRSKPRRWRTSSGNSTRAAARSGRGSLPEAGEREAVYAASSQVNVLLMRLVGAVVTLQPAEDHRREDREGAKDEKRLV